MTDELEFRDPRPAQSRSSDPVLDSMEAKLRKLAEEGSGRWALVHVYTGEPVSRGYSFATRINQGKFRPSARLGKFHAAARREHDPERVEVFARYLGPPEEE